MRPPPAQDASRKNSLNWRAGSSVRLKTASGQGKPPHGSSSAPETSRNRPESTARSFFRARIAPNFRSQGRFHRTKAIARQALAFFTARRPFRTIFRLKLTHGVHFAPSRLRQRQRHLHQHRHLSQKASCPILTLRLCPSCAIGLPPSRTQQRRRKKSIPPDPRIEDRAGCPCGHALYFSCSSQLFNSVTRLSPFQQNQLLTRKYR